MLRLSLRARGLPRAAARRLASSDASAKISDPRVTVTLEDGCAEQDEVGDDMSSRTFVSAQKKGWRSVSFSSIFFFFLFFLSFVSSFHA